MKYFSVLFFLATLNTPAYAYLDPATGGALMGIVSAGVVSSAFFIKILWYKFKSFSNSKNIPKHLVKNRHYEIVVHAEGKNYNRDFKPLIDNFEMRGVAYVYFTSDKDDPLLNNGQNTNRLYVGEGYEAFTFLNTLSADIFISTTAGLDVLQLKRSKSVKHYMHLLHSPGDISFYKIYSFDYFDSVLTCGSHQEKSLRSLETLRNTQEKTVLKCGCIYYDFLCKEVEKLEPSPATLQTILIAPTWGANGLFSRGGDKLINRLVEDGFNIIVRPHPQSFISEKELMNDLQSSFAHNPKVEFDLAVSSVASMVNSCLMISDLSGIILDYAFLFEKPIIVFSQDIQLNGLEANDLDHQVWELDLIEEACIQLQDTDMDEIHSIVRNTLSNPSTLIRAKEMRDEFVANFGKAAPVATDLILDTLNSINQR